MEEKVLSLGKFSAFATFPHFGLLKMLVLEHHVTTRKPTMIKKGIITFKAVAAVTLRNTSLVG